MENRGLKTIIAINLFDVTMGSYDGAEIFADKNGRSFHLKPSRKNAWQGKHRLISGRRFGNYQKQISAFGRQYEEGAPQNFLTI